MKKNAPSSMMKSKTSPDVSERVQENNKELSDRVKKDQKLPRNELKIANVEHGQKQLRSRSVEVELQGCGDDDGNDEENNLLSQDSVASRVHNRRYIKKSEVGQESEVRQENNKNFTWGFEEADGRVQLVTSLMAVCLNLKRTRTDIWGASQSMKKGGWLFVYS